MSEYVISQSAQDLIYLIHCALHGQKAAAERVNGFNMENLFTLAKFHSLNAMASFPLEGMVSDDVMVPWREGRERALRRNLLLDIERQHLCGVMENWGIWHMRLKGSIIKDLYPRMEMRQMSDQDILFDDTYRKKIRQYMVSRGYDPKGRHDSHHDIYFKNPVYNIEMHRTLFEKNCDLRIVNYYKKIKERLIPDAPGSYGCHFTDEDFYIYMIAHAYKHYQIHGVGLRSYVDVYVYEMKKGATMDWDYVRQECAKMGMETYEEQCRIMARKLFAGDRIEELDAQEKEVLRFCFDSGTHGCENGRIRHQLRQHQAAGKKIGFWANFPYLMRRRFPSMEWMKQKSLMVRKHPWTLPFAWVGRLFRGIFKRGGHTAAELRYVMESEES